MTTKDGPVVGVVVPATGGKASAGASLTPEQLARLQQAQARDKAYADAKAVAQRIRRRVREGHSGSDLDEVDVLVSYFLDHG